MPASSEPTHSHTAYAERASPWWSWQISRQLEHWYTEEELSALCPIQTNPLSPTSSFVTGYFVFGQHSAEKLLPCCEMSCSKPLVLHTCLYTQLTIPLAKSSEPDLYTVLGLAHDLVSLGLLALGSSLIPGSTSCRSIPIHGAFQQHNPSARAPSLYKVNLHSYRHLIL